MELLTLTILLFAWYGICALWGVANTWRIFILVITFLTITFTAYITYYDTLSKPKDATFEMFRNDKEVKVIAYAINQGVALYVLLSLDNLSEPRYYKYPWNEQTEKMAKALVEGKENEQRMMISKPFEKSLSKERVAHPEPQKAMPDKKPPSNAEIIDLETEF